MINKLNSYIDKKLNTNSIRYKDSTDSFNAYLITRDFIKNDKTIFVVLPNLYEAQKYYDLISKQINEEKVLFYPSDQILTTMMALGSPEFESERLFTINQLITKESFIVVTTTEAVMRRQLTIKDYESAKKILKRNEFYNIDELALFLVNNGYQKNYTVESPGEFAVRGGIVDIYLRNNKNPYRLDFFDNYLESIKLFDVDTQRSFKEVDSIEISPLNELFYTDKMLEDAIKKIKYDISKYKASNKELEKLEFDIENLENRRNLSKLNIYIPYFNKEETTIFDFSDNKKVYAIDYYKMEINEKQKEEDLKVFETTMSGNFFTNIDFNIDFNLFSNNIDTFIDNIGLVDKNAESFGVFDVNQYHGNIDLFLYDLKKQYDKYDTYLSIKGMSYKQEITDKILDIKNVEIIKEDVLGSFYIPSIKFAIFDDESIFNKKMKTAIRYRSVLNQSTKIRHISELEIGDYVVHYEFGIGRYMGLKTMDLSGYKRDYLYIVYKDDESLYVPIEQINLVLKYSSYDGMQPKLSKMGGKQWERTKASVKKKIKDLSDRLLKIYATREMAKGHAFAEDHELQKQLESDFSYILTQDQEKTIQSVKVDMEKPKPMDRLIIGDVGFGKTEVALRAAFKAVLDNKQVMYLAPTTVLSRQHYYTFKERFEKYGARVELINRFVTKKNQTKIINDLREGRIDVIIGTHRLLSDDIVFKDLGLLIVDEEQRFGVMHKERIKEIKVNVDTLTLTATPIPRTLQMSLMGIKDLSTIETPPLNRYPVQTYVVPREYALIKEAIRREIARGGQVFYLYNKVETMENMVYKIQELIPEAKITYAHGRMRKDELEKKIVDFIDHKYDILVSTTIIETGIDIPNTNTLIIHEADKLGLSQLYQIRGRVGRSDKIAYAYLMYDPGKLLKDESQKRLKALEEFTALGSGYKIAMKDLSIRGAGDILGSEQSGFIDSVGMELYTKMLEEVMYGKEIVKEPKIKSVYSERHIDPEYIEKDSVRIEIHKKVSELNKLSDIEDLKDELEDRFGKVDIKIINYMYEQLFTKLSSEIGVYNVVNSQDNFKLIIDEENSQKIDGLKLFELTSLFKREVKLGYLNNEVEITIRYNKKEEHWLYVATVFVDAFINGINLNNKRYFNKKPK